jgi:hypothetical protein
MQFEEMEFWGMQFRIAREKLKRANFVTHDMSANKIHTSLIHVLRKVIEQIIIDKNTIHFSNFGAIHNTCSGDTHTSWFRNFSKYGDLHGRQR